MLKFTLPKTVSFANTRLRLLYWGLFLVVLTSAIVEFISGSKYYSPSTLQPRFASELWANSPRLDDAKQEIEQSMNDSAFCLSPERYDYWWDAPGVWRYDNFKCLPMCPEGTHGWGCLHMSDLSDQYGLDRAVVVTASRETFYPSTNSRTSIPHSRNYWTMSARSISVDFTYSYEVPEKNPLSVLLDQMRAAFGMRLANAILRASSTGGHGMTPLHTVILDAKGQFWRAVLPGASITLTVSELLELIGETALLENPNQYATPNQLQREGVMSGNPAAHITGVSLLLEVGCYNGPNPALIGTELPTEVSDLDRSHMCTLKVRRRPNAWATRTRKDYLESGLLVRWTSGIDISVSYTGEYQYVDVSHLFITLMSIIVALGIPEKMVLFISMNCLGHLSAMYKRVLVQDFDITEQVAGAAVRLSACSLSYEAFRDQAKSTGFPFALFRERLQLIMRGTPHVDEEEIDRMAEFCFSRVVKTPRQKRSASNRLATTLGIEAVQLSEQDHKVMGLDAFCSAYCRSDPIDFTDMSIFFDRDRRVSFLERFFTPRKFWTRVHNSCREYQAAEDPGVPSAGGAVDSGSRAAGSQLADSEASGRMSFTGSPSEDAQAIATSLSNMLERLSATELRLAESERSVMEWKQQSSDLEFAMREMERSVQELRGRVESAVGTQADRVLGTSIRPTAVPDLEQAEQRLQDLEHVVVSSPTSALETSAAILEGIAVETKQTDVAALEDAVAGLVECTEQLKKDYKSIASIVAVHEYNREQLLHAVAEARAGEQGMGIEEGLQPAPTSIEWADQGCTNFSQTIGMSDGDPGPASDAKFSQTVGVSVLERADPEPSSEDSHLRDAASAAPGCASM